MNVSNRVGHDWSDLAAAAAAIFPWCYRHRNHNLLFPSPSPLPPHKHTHRILCSEGLLYSRPWGSPLWSVSNYLYPEAVIYAPHPCKPACCKGLLQDLLHIHVTSCWLPAHRPAFLAPCLPRNSSPAQPAKPINTTAIKWAGIHLLQRIWNSSKLILSWLLSLNPKVTYRVSLNHIVHLLS